MLDIPKLKALATKQLQTELDDNWMTGIFPAVVAEVFDITASRDKEIREVVVMAAKEHLAELLPLEHFGEVMDKCGEFSAGLVRIMQETVVKQRSTTCRHCCNKLQWAVY
jgi:hypothetical protein